MIVTRGRRSDAAVAEDSPATRATATTIASIFACTRKRVATVQASIGGAETFARGGGGHLRRMCASLREGGSHDRRCRHEHAPCQRGSGGHCPGCERPHGRGERGLGGCL